MVRRELFLLGAALGLGVLAQQRLTPLGASRAFVDLPKEQAGVGFALLAAAGILAALAMWRERDDARDGFADTVAAGATRGGLLRAAVASIALATGIAYLDVQSPIAIYPWVIGLMLLVASAAGVAPSPSAIRRPMRRSEWVGLIVLVALAFLWRYPEVGAIPAQVHGDEAACGLEARRILRGEVPNLLGLGWYDIPTLSFALSALSMRIFGDDLYGLRLASVLLGVGSVALLYLSMRRLYGFRVALIAGFLVAVSHWHVHFSRIGTDYMQASFATMSVLFFLVRARQEGRPLDWVLAGLSIGLCFSVYYAARVIVPVLVVFAAIERLTERETFRRTSSGMVMMILSAVLFVAPIYAVTARIPSSVTDRSRGVLLFSPDNLAHAFESTETDSLAELLVLQAANSLSAFNWQGERSDQHSHAAPLLDFWTGAVFAVSVVAITALGWRRRYRLVVFWFWVNLVLGSMLTVDAMFSPRMVVAVPMLFVFPALLLDRTMARADVSETRVVSVGVALAVLGLGLAAAASNYRDYFELHVGRLQTPRRPTVLGNFVRDADDAQQIFVYGNFPCSTTRRTSSLRTATPSTWGPTGSIFPMPTGLRPRSPWSSIRTGEAVPHWRRRSRRPTRTPLARPFAWRAAARPSKCSATGRFRAIEHGRGILKRHSDSRVGTALRPACYTASA